MRGKGRVKVWVRPRRALAFGEPNHLSLALLLGRLDGHAVGRDVVRVDRSDRHRARELPRAFRVRQAAPLDQVLAIESRVAAVADDALRRGERAVLLVDGVAVGEPLEEAREAVLTQLAVLWGPGVEMGGSAVEKGCGTGWV